MSEPAAPPLTAVVLAGERAAGDPHAREAGVAHKSLLEVGGVPMLLRVVRALAGVEGVGRILVSARSPALLDAHSELVALREAGRLFHRPSGDSPATSVQELLSAEPLPGALLVTTSDHPLLTSEMVARFCSEARATGADVVAAVVSDGVFRARFPDAPRTFIPLRDEAVTGANLFWFRSGEGSAVAGFWRQTESIRKRPWRLALVFGLPMLVRFALRRVRLEDATRRLSQTLGLEVAVVRLPWAECGIDVDRPADLELVERLLAD